MAKLVKNVVEKRYIFTLVPISGGEPRCKIHVKAESEDAARLKLFEPELGYKWELIEQEENNG